MSTFRAPSERRSTFNPVFYTSDSETGATLADLDQKLNRINGTSSGQTLASPSFTGTVSMTSPSIAGFAGFKIPTNGPNPHYGSTTAFGTVAANLTGGDADLSFLNNGYGTAASRNFTWYRATSATTNTILASLTGTGNWSVTGTITSPTIVAIQTALDLKAPLASPTFTGTVSGVTKGMVELGNVDNTSDANKQISSLTQTALDAKAPLASPTFTGTVSGVTKAMVNLGNVDNTSDTNKQISSLTQTALDAKAPLASPSFTGTVSMNSPAITGFAGFKIPSSGPNPHYGSTTAFGAVAANLTGGDADLSFLNNGYGTAASRNFTWYRATSATTNTILASLTGTGNWNVTGTITSPTIDAINTDVSLKAPLASPAFTGNVSLSTADASLTAPNLLTTIAGVANSSVGTAVTLNKSEISIRSAVVQSSANLDYTGAGASFHSTLPGTIIMDTSAGARTICLDMPAVGVTDTLRINRQLTIKNTGANSVTIQTTTSGGIANFLTCTGALKTTMVVGPNAEMRLHSFRNASLQFQWQELSAPVDQVLTPILTLTITNTTLTNANLPRYIIAPISGGNKTLTFPSLVSTDSKYSGWEIQVKCAAGGSGYYLAVSGPIVNLVGTTVAGVDSSGSQTFTFVTNAGQYVQF